MPEPHFAVHSLHSDHPLQLHVTFTGQDSATDNKTHNMSVIEKIISQKYNHKETASTNKQKKHSTTPPRTATAQG